MIDQLIDIVGEAYVLRGADTASYSRDWMGHYEWTPLAVVRPANTHEVSEIVKLANVTNTALVPISGGTGLVGGASAEGAVMLSLERMNTIREVRADARVAIVEAGVILANLHAAVEAEDMIFPLFFGARGSALIGGVLSTNAGGSNVLRYGNTRDLCLGLEVVLPTGEIMDIMSELHKDNSGYNLKHLMIGAEGTLGIITAATLKLFPKPRAYATAMVAVPSLADALTLLNKLQAATGGAVEAFEYMPRAYVERHLRFVERARAPFDELHDVNILLEVGATRPEDATAGDTGQTPLMAHLEETLAALFEEGAVLDAVVAQNEAQRREMWDRREAAAEITTTGPTQSVAGDIAVPLDKVATFLEQFEPRLAALDAGAESLAISHLGDGNLHLSVWPSTEDEELADQVVEVIEELTLELGGSFSAEHGIGKSKLNSMARRKNPAALATMRAIKTALDPANILNPGKVIPD